MQICAKWKTVISLVKLCAPSYAAGTTQVTLGLSYGGHVLMENRNGVCVDILITESPQVERRAAAFMRRRSPPTRTTT